MTDKMPMNWSRISIVSVIAFLVGWPMFGLPGAMVMTVVVMVLIGIIRGDISLNPGM